MSRCYATQQKKALEAKEQEEQGEEKTFQIIKREKLLPPFSDAASRRCAPVNARRRQKHNLFANAWSTCSKIARVLQ